MVRIYKIQNFDKGVVNEIEDFSIPENAASDSLNWLTKGDMIELTGGYTLVDSDNEIAGTGKVTGLHVSEKVDGSNQLFYSYGQKIKYLDANGEWQEIGTDILGSDADGEDISFTSYTSLSGYQTWVSSPNSSLFKIMTANPSSYTNMYDATKNHKGYIDAQNSRLHLWMKEGAKNYLYGSWKDAQDSTVYTTVTAEAIGSSGSTNYTGTLTFKGGGAKRTCFNVVFTDGTQTAQDDKNGNFVGDATGTINYTTGAYNITFLSSTTGSVTSTYQWEDSTNNGLADFTFSSPRVAGEGYFLPQNTGGDLLSVLPYRTDFYCIHENNVYLFSMPISDTNPTNQIFRRKVGMKNWKGAVATGDGIYYIDTSEPAEPRFKLLTLETTSDQVVPITISFNFNLKNYNWDDCISYEFAEYIVFVGKTLGANANNRVFLYSKTWKSFDPVKYFVSCFTDNAGVLIAGDSASNNVMQLFTGYTANGSNIENYWESKLTRLQIEEIKKTKRLSFEGLIVPQQQLGVYLSYDRDSFVKLGVIEGTGSHIDASQSVTIGAIQIGVSEVGGGGSGIASHYLKEFRVRSDKFDQVKIRFVAEGVGYVSVSTINFYDIKLYGQKNILRYRTT